MSETQKLITFTEALEILPIGKVTFYRMLEKRNNTIPHYRIGSQYFFDPDELLDFFRRGIHTKQYGGKK